MDPQDARLTGPFYANDGPMTRFYEYPALTEWEYRQEVARRSLNEVRRARELNPIIPLTKDGNMSHKTGRDRSAQQAAFDSIQVGAEKAACVIRELEPSLADMPLGDPRRERFNDALARLCEVMHRLDNRLIT